MQICQAPNFASETVLIGKFFWKFSKIRSHFWLDFRGHIFFLWSPCIGDQKDQYIFRDIFFFLCSPCMGMQKYQWGTHFFSVRSLCGTYFLSRFFEKALRARSARFARSAPRPAFGRPWRALRWENTICSAYYVSLLLFLYFWSFNWN